MTSTHDTAKTAAVTAVSAWAHDAKPMTVTGDTRGEYSPVARALGYEPIDIGSGLGNRLNPLNLGPLAAELGSTSVHHPRATEAPVEADQEPPERDDDSPPALRWTALVRCVVGLLIGTALSAALLWTLYALNGGEWPDIGPIGDPNAGRSH